MGEILKSIARRPKLLMGVLWMVLFTYGLGKMLVEREWGNAIFCAAFLVVGAIVIARAARADRELAAKSSERAKGSGPPPIEPQ
ncbi:MAG TPA: hypothetical protein VKF80_03055 [Candidatus Eisenbacteria bacterium]|nr:hypothetical protein [Candidatus Eisenbacteria bacterium]